MANINRAKTACRILTTLGFLPMAPHLYFTQFLKDEDAQERNTGMKLGMRWLEDADELWVFGNTISEGMAAEIEKAGTQSAGAGASGRTALKEHLGTVPCSAG